MKHKASCLIYTLCYISFHTFRSWRSLCSKDLIRNMCVVVRYVLKHGAAFFELGLPVAIRRFEAYYECMQPSMSFSSADGVPPLPALIATLSLALCTSGQVRLPLFGTPGTVYIRRASSLAIVVVPRPPNSLTSASLAEPS